MTVFHLEVKRMHTLRNRILFFGSAAAVGLAALGLHRYMLEHCFDAKGLLIAGNLPGKLLWVLSIGFAVCLGALLTTIGGEGSYGDNFPRCTVSGLLMIAAGAVLAVSVPQLGLDREQTVVFAAPWIAAVHASAAKLLGVLPYLAAASMAVVGACRMAGRRPWYIFSGIVCLFYMQMLVSNYRIWSADPKLYSYAYPILAGALLMLCAFHRTSCDCSIIQRRRLLFTGLTGGACAIASLSVAVMPGFFISGALWAFGSMCSPAVLPPDPDPEPEPEPEEEQPAQEPQEETAEG